MLFASTSRNNSRAWSQSANGTFDDAADDAGAAAADDDDDDCDFNMDAGGRLTLCSGAHRAGSTGALSPPQHPPALIKRCIL